MAARCLEINLSSAPHGKLEILATLQAENNLLRERLAAQPISARIPAFRHGEV